MQKYCCLLNACVGVQHRLAQQSVFLLTKGLLSQQQAQCGTVSASLAGWLLGSRPVAVRQAPYVPSTNLEEWVTQKCVSEPSQVNLLCANLVLNRGENTVPDCKQNVVGIKPSVVLFLLPHIHLMFWHLLAECSEI